MSGRRRRERRRLPRHQDVHGAGHCGVRRKGWDVSGFTVQVDDGTTALLPIADHWSEINDTVTAAVESFLQGSTDSSVFKTANDSVNALFQ